jgi:phosphate starvation-inducible PhoH-like protein
MAENSDSKKTSLDFANIDLARQLFGERNNNLKKIAGAIDVSVNARGNTVFVQGQKIAADLACNVLNQLYGLLKEGYALHPNDIDYAVRVLSGDDRADLKKIFLDTVYITSKKSTVAPKSPAQKEYIDAIRKYDIVFGIGPAGTGKTYLAMAMAVSALSKGIVSRIILARPAVEAGEALGFLPGDLAEKVDPYLRPLYDALHDMMRFEKASTLLQQGIIEVAPIAFMRGRTLNDSFIILDEAQNTTSEQMKMFLTRIGYSSKAVITGDITQIDLPGDRISGLSYRVSREFNLSFLQKGTLSGTNWFRKLFGLMKSLKPVGKRRTPVEICDCFQLLNLWTPTKNGQRKKQRIRRQAA